MRAALSLTFILIAIAVSVSMFYLIYQRELQHIEMTPEAKMSIRTGLVYGINDFIQKLPGSAFDNPELASQRKNEMQKVLLDNPDSVLALARAEMLEEGIEKLQKDVRTKTDSSVGGDSKDDWIVDPEAQEKLIMLIDNLIASLEKQK